MANRRARGLAGPLFGNDRVSPVRTRNARKALLEVAAGIALGSGFVAGGCSFSFRSSRLGSPCRAGENPEAGAVGERSKVRGVLRPILQPAFG